VRRGECASNARLTEPQIREIRELAKSGVSQTEIASHYGVTRGAISHVVTRRNWRHVL
jgi:IS30 family transposase